MDKLFIPPTVPSGAEGWLNQLTSDIAGTAVATLGKSDQIFFAYSSGYIWLFYL